MEPLRLRGFAHCRWQGSPILSSPVPPVSDPKPRSESQAPKQRFLARDSKLKFPGLNAKLKLLGSFVLALNKAQVLALNTARVLRITTAEVLALNKAHVMRLSNKICQVFRASTKETTKGGSRRPPPFVEAALEGSYSISYSMSLQHGVLQCRCTLRRLRPQAFRET